MALASSEELAAWLRANADKKGTPDYQTVLRGFQEAVVKESAVKPAAPTAKPESGFFPAFKAGKEQLMGGLAALAGRTGLMDVEAAQKEYEARQQKAKEIFAPTEAGWTESPVTKTLELLGGSLPYVAAPLVAGAGAATLPVTGTAATVLGLGAAGLASTAQFTATNLSRQLEEGKGKVKIADTDLGAAALAAVPQAALDTISLRMIPGIGRIFGRAGVELTEETAKKVVDQGLKKVAADYALATGKTMGVEGLTEAAQQVFERAQAGLNITDEAARKEYFDSFLGGAVLGGTLAPAGRYLERGSEQRKAKQVLQDVENKRAAEAQAAEEANKKDPEYALKLDADYQAAVAKMRELQAAVPKKPGKDALPEEWMAYKEAKEARDTHLNEVLKPLTTEWRTRQAEIAQLKERRRVEGMTPEEYMLEQMGVKPAAALTEPATLEEAALDAADLSKTQTTPEASAVEKYVADRIELANQQTFGTATAKDYVDYLMQDPIMASQIVASEIALPGLDEKTNAAVLSALKLQLEKKAKPRLAQEQADLQAQKQVAEKDPLALWKASLEQAEDQATEELLRADVENINAAQPPIVDVPEGVAPMPDPRRMLARIDELIATRDQAVRDAESAFATGNQELGTKKAAEREAAQSGLNNLSQTEGVPRVIIDLRKAQDTALLNTAQLTDDLKSGRVLGGSQAGTASSTPATLINQINKQREAFIRAAIQEAATIRRLFGRNLTQEEATAAAKRMQAVFDEWVTRSMAEPRSAVDFIKSYERDPKLARADWLATAADAFVKDRVRMALAEKMRGPRLASIERGAPEERALTTALTPEEIRAVEQKALREFAAAVEKTQPRQPTYQIRGTKTVVSDEGKARFVDPRPLEERQFGAFKAATEVLQEQLQKIVSRLTEVPQRGQRVEPVLKTQFAPTEAGKVAEERGETAQTLEGALRRRRDYVDNLIDQALQTRNVPGIARMLLERAQDFLQKPLAIKTVDETTGKETVRYQPRGTTAFLDAAENLASRLVLGQNIERSDLVDLRNELRAESARPGEAEVVGEREGQRELFGTEERRKDLGVIRETRARFENAPIVKRARAAAEKAKKLLEDLRVAFDAADAAAEKAKASKIKKAETDVEARREDLREAFQTALKKAQIAEVTAKFQPQIDALIQQLSVFGKERAKALREKETVYAKDLNIIIQTEREALQDLRQQLADALRAPSAFVEPATLPKGATRVVRGLTQPAELAAAGDEWVQFERDRLAKAEAKLRNLKGPERITVAKEVQQQRVTLNEAENIVNRARTGLGLPGLRVERQAIRAEIEALEARIPNIKDPKKQKKAQNRLGSLYKMLGESAKTIEGEVALTHIEVLRKKLRETTRDTTLSKKERNQKLAELNRQLAAAESIRGSKLQPVQERAQISSAEAAKRAEEKVATQEELENRALAVADEIEDLRGARARARTEASKQQIQDQIDERNKELTLLKGQLETPTLTRTEARQARKPQKTVFTGKGAEAGAETVATLQERLTDGVKAAVKRLRAANITVLEEGKRLAGPPIAGVLTRAEVRQQVLETEFTAAERKVLLGKTTQTPKQRAKLRELGDVVAATEGFFPSATAVQATLRRERAPSEQEEVVESVKETNVEDVMSFFDIGGKDVYFSRGATSNPSTTDSVRAELKKQFPDLGRVQIYDSVDALIKANPQYKGKIPADARGFVDTAGNKAFLIAENINQGQALSVLLHEVGAHIGMRETLGKQYNASINAVENWAKKDDGSLESRIAKAAQARVEKADTPASQQRDELIAYAVEEAVNAGVKPTETKSPIGRWLGQILSMFRNALRKFGLASKDLTAQELVDMAYGAAKLELRGQAASEAKATKDFIVSRTTAFIKGAKGEEPFASAGLKQITEDDTAYDTVGDATFITGMEVRERNKGFGKKLLENLTLWADENNKRLALLPAAQFDKQLGGLTQEQLKEWYARNGFKLVGDYMVREPKVGELFFSKKTDYAPGMAGAGKVADMVVAKQPSTIDKIKKNLFGLEFRTQVIDALAPLEKIANTSMDALKGTQMMYYLRMYGMRNNMTAQAISNGVPQLKEITRADGRKEWIFESVKGANIKQIVERLSQKDVVQQAGSPDAANRLFTLYMAAIRGENVGYDKLNFGRDAAEKELVQIKRELASPRLSAQDKASLLARQSHLEKNIPSMPTEADFKSAKAEIENNPTLKNAFNEARGMYNEYNTNLLNFLVQVGAMSKEEAARLLRAKDYIPYYRMRGGNAELVIGGETPIRIGNLKDSPHLQELVGGEEPIFNFLDSSVQNTSMLLDMGMRNIATKNVAFELGQVGLASKPIKTPVAGAPTGTLEFKKDGVDYYVTVNTDYIGVPSDLLVKGMAGIPTMLPQGLRLMGVPSQILRRAVTSTPVFAVRQLFRESLGAFMLSGSDATPLLSSINQLRKDSSLEARGVTGGQVFTGTTEDMSRLLREMQSGRPGWSKAFAKMEAFALKTDAATRQAQFESYRNQGLSEMEASFMALESMNFSKRGLSATMHMASMLVPFLNAQIQGLDVLYKGLTGNMPLNEKLDIQRKVFTRGAMMFMATMAYAAAMQDDEEYKNAPPDQKYGNWFVRLPFLDEIAGEKVTLRVPVPFEIGYVFKSLPEMLYNSLQSKKDAEDAFKALNHILIQMVPGGSSMVPIELGGVKVPVPVPIPAAMKPVIEVGLGKSFFTGRDIESAREQQEVPGMRYRQQTSELAKLIGEAVNFSPIKIESLINGYTGGLGLLAMQALSVPLPKASVVVPESRWSELPLVGTMFQPSDAGNIIDGVYKDFEKVKQAKTTYDRLIEKGETGKAQAFLQENLQLITLNQFAGNYTQRMRELTKNESIIRGSNLTAEEKRTLLDQIKQAKIQTATAVRGVLEKRGLQASPA